MEHIYIYFVGTNLFIFMSLLFDDDDDDAISVDEISTAVV